MRQPTARLLCLLLPALLAACAAPSATPASAPAARPAASVAEVSPDAPAAEGSVPQPAAAGAPVQVDRSCRTSADCVVKDVGNCCGRFPACVNQDSPTDPKAVMAQCQAQGIASVCGYREISACECVAGTCQAPAQERRLRHGVRVGP